MSAFAGVFSERLQEAGFIAGLALFAFAGIGAGRHLWRERKPKMSIVGTSGDESEYVSLDEAATWLYKHAPAGLRAILQDHRPFSSITANAAAHIGTAADDGIGGFYARRERGFPLEPLKYIDSRQAWPSSDGRQHWRGFISDPSVKRADLPLFLKYYAAAVPSPAIEARRDKALGEAVAYWCTREWGLNRVEVVLAGRGNIHAALSAIKQGHLDGDIRLWAKPLYGDVWAEFTANKWATYDFKDTPLGVGEPDIVAIDTKYTAYKEPMVSQAEIECLREHSRG
ncbi:hypothetical protein [Phenylobacterium sp.]|uniref:hypothetical protein n=1 Tax=Phenylobacterium sp. TaxID=1871053 RepID=UPI002869F704|nr:hypothetical protein [Phenylobacterium sp.]